MELESAIEALATRLRAADRLTVLTGAGVSAAVDHAIHGPAQDVLKALDRRVAPS